MLIARNEWPQHFELLLHLYSQLYHLLIAILLQMVQKLLNIATLHLQQPDWSVCLFTICNLQSQVLPSYIPNEPIGLNSNLERPHRTNSTVWKTKLDWMH
jgi:hypothetical protein